MDRNMADSALCSARMMATDGCMTNPLLNGLTDHQPQPVTNTLRLSMATPAGATLALEQEARGQGWEDELVEIGLQVRRLHRSVVGIPRTQRLINAATRCTPAIETCAGVSEPSMTVR